MSALCATKLDVILYSKNDWLVKPRASKTKIYGQGDMCAIAIPVHREPPLLAMTVVSIVI
ncbi:hypothetical protein [Acaryochloris marina]|uniref:Uncharacterized protein n=1 Tax=Acaryochloris marina (strain MBIC 11017) TaxID=329726 RepID=B0C028_ACAM1|nr:hypothetical protein [Acaryochloris marina]ABW28375.1 hypothetical protein AM1_3380 [Acaryochloris marina MBIC11017]